MKIALIAAMDENALIGVDNTLPNWKAPGDLKRFKELTMGKVLIMGRKTFESMGSKPLPGRYNIVVSSNNYSTFQYKNPIDPTQGSSRTTFEDALYLAMVETKNNPLVTSDEIMVIGGNSIFSLALPVADACYFTSIRGRFSSSEQNKNVYFPIHAFRQFNWKLTKEVELPTHTYKDYERIR